VQIGVVGFWSSALPAACKANPRCFEELKPQKSWIPGGMADHSDGQSREFREGLPLLLPAAGGMIAIGWAVRWFVGQCQSTERQTAQAIAQLQAPPLLMTWYFVSALVFGAALLKSELLILLTMISGFWALTTLIMWLRMSLRSSPANSWQRSFDGVLQWVGPFLVWGAAGMIKVVGEVFGRSLGFVSVATKLLPLVQLSDHAQSAILDAAFALERHRGGLPWYSLYGLIMLRLISWGMDTHWAINNSTATPASEKEESSDSLAARTATHHSLETYSLAKAARSWFTLMAYSLYPATIIAGPIVSFNAWISQVKSPQRSLSPWQQSLVVARAAILVLSLEGAMQFVPFFSAAKHGAYTNFGAQEIAAFGYTAIVMLWLKFATIWAFFRAWATLDGVQVPDNMRRCVSNNFSLMDFWRSWHRSYNLWLVRYLYIPLGGSRVGVLRQIFNTMLVFVFVALWHDVKPELLIWGVLIGLLFVPETVARALVNPKGGVFAHWRGSVWFRHLVAAAAASNIFIMIVPNVIGYTGMGKKDGSVAQALTDIFLAPDGGGINAQFLGGMFFLLFVAAQIQLRVRAEEERRYGAIKEDWRGELPPSRPSQEAIDWSYEMVESLKQKRD
jgi:D-alanyl-lipoteichoic acid acyltransferase DltB (MBOAT superfamily)